MSVAIEAKIADLRVQLRSLELSYLDADAVGDTFIGRRMLQIEAQIEAWEAIMAPAVVLPISGASTSSDFDRSCGYSFEI